MNPVIPSYIDIMFLLTAIATLLFMYSIVKQVNARTGKIFLTIAVLWLAISGILAFNGFYQGINEQPIRFFLAFPVTAVVMIIIFANRKSRLFVARMSAEKLIYLSIIRVPVEVVLWWYALYGQIPEVMTFEGRNFDIIAGITAPMVAYFCFTKGSAGIGLARAWNVISLLLLLNIILHAMLALPTPLQQIALDRPNVGILSFPLLWLASFVAPAVLFSHFANFLTLRRG